MTRRLAAGLSVWLGAAAAAGVYSAASSAHPGAPMWSMTRTMTRIDGANVSVRRWRAHVRSATTLCNGEGRGARWNGARHWRHFTCTWTVFDRRGLVDRDVTFRLHTLTARRFVISEARFGAG
jgi:hypothetical protein